LPLIARTLTLSSTEITQKSGVLEQFWSKAKAKPNVYIPALRQELANLQNPPFFLYDGSMLLLSLSNTPIDRKVALAAIAHNDVRDVQPRDYFFQVHRMATLNEDTTAAAFQILEQPDFKVFIPQHLLMMGQNYILIYMLLPTSQESWLQPAVNRLPTESDETARKSLILLLWYAQAEAADKAIATLAADSTRSSAVCDYAQQIMHAKDKVGATLRGRGSGFHRGFAAPEGAGTAQGGQ
jgi:hypothetical protein